MGLRFVMEEDDERYVYWMEKRGRGCFLQATPIDVSHYLAEKLFHKVDTIVLTSATLAVAGGFEFVEKRLGVENARTLVVPGHFDYQKQALLYVPQEMPGTAQPGVHQGGGERSDQDTGTQPRPRLRAVHQLPADAAGVRGGLVRD